MAAAATIFTPVAEAADVSGTLRLNGKPVVARRVLVHLHDNAEGVFERPLKILVSEAPVPLDLLDGIGDTRAMRQGREGRVRGVLFQVDPKRPGDVFAARLEKAAVDAQDPGDLVGSDRKPAASDLRMGADRMQIRLKRPADAGASPLDFDLVIDAPIRREPAITAELKGAALRASPAYLAVLRMVEAQIKGDLDTAMKLSTAGTRATLYEPALAAGQRKELVAQLRTTGPIARAALAKATRLVERGGSALILLGNGGFFGAVREGGEWLAGE